MEWDPCVAVVATLERCLCSQLETKVAVVHVIGEQALQVR